MAACVWDHAAGGRGPLSLFWEASTRSIRKPWRVLWGTGEGELATLFDEAGLDRVEDGELTSRSSTPSFEDWWEPYTLGVGPAGVTSRVSTPPRENGSARAAARCFRRSPSRSRFARGQREDGSELGHDPPRCSSIRRGHDGAEPGGRALTFKVRGTAGTRPQPSSQRSATHPSRHSPRPTLRVVGRRRAARPRVPSQPACPAPRSRTTGHAPSDVFETTVYVVSVSGSWAMRNDTPAS